MDWLFTELERSVLTAAIEEASTFTVFTDVSAVAYLLLGTTLVFGRAD